MWTPLWSQSFAETVLSNFGSKWAKCGHILHFFIQNENRGLIAPSIAPYFCKKGLKPPRGGYSPRWWDPCILIINQLMSVIFYDLDLATHTYSAWPNNREGPLVSPIKKYPFQKNEIMNNFFRFDFFALLFGNYPTTWGVWGTKSWGKKQYKRVKYKWGAFLCPELQNLIILTLLTGLKWVF